MKNTIYILLGFVLLTLFTGCEMKQEIWKKPNVNSIDGTLQIHRVSSESIPLKPNTSKADAGQGSVNVDDFGMAIYNKDSEVPVKEYHTYRELKESGLSVVLPAGEYIIKAFSDSEEVSASWDHPYFSGQENFLIEPGVITEINLVCYMQSVKVQIDLSDEFLGAFKDDYAITITNGESVLVFDSQTPLVGYFKPTEPLKMTITATTKEGNEVRYRTTLANADGTIHPKDFFVVNLKIDVAQVEIPKNQILVVDTELIKENVSITIPTPNEDSGSGGGGGTNPPEEGAPTIVGDGFDIKGNFTFPKAQAQQVAVKVNITATSGIKNLNVTIESDYLTPEVLGTFGIPTQFDMANLSPTLAENFSQIGLLKGNIKGEKSLVFDISPFMGLLIPGTHKFHLEVIDNNNASTKETLTVVMTE